MRKLLGLEPGDTLASVLSRHRGIGPGFDFLRVGLAIIIFIGHAKWVAGGQSLGTAVDLHAMAATLPVDPATSNDWVGVTKPIKKFLVPAFFALSGFLVMGSAARLRRTSTFLSHRALRIFPALIVEVALSALLLGPAMTVLPLREYFADPQFARYLLNAVGHVTLWLPGVLTDGSSVSQSINVNLWTLPAEFYSYLLLSALMVTTIAYRRGVLAILVLATGVILAALNALYATSYPDTAPHAHHVVVFYFLAGVLAYQWRERIPVRIDLFVVSALVSYATLMFNTTIYLAVPFVVYCTVFIGMVNFPKSKILKSGDYSYGLYLYGFPITQALVHFVPTLRGQQIAVIVLAFAISCLFAVASWHLVEKHALKLKRALPERWFPTTPRERALAV